MGSAFLHGNHPNVSVLNHELDPEIEHFLDENPDLRPLLAETVSKTAAYFPKSTPRLELVHDPEEDVESLVMYVSTQEDVAVGERIYDRFVDEWWLDRKRQAGSRFAVMMEYV